MVFFNYSTMQMAAKVVYYGPGLCGKTTNLQWVYDHTSNDSRGEMVSLATETDRTLFFDLLPIDVGSIAGFSTRIQLYTVPGQVFYNTTRKLVLKGVDGVVFVADSQRPMVQANIESFQNLEENLAEMGLSLDTVPVVLQFNKRDLPSICTVEEMNESLNRGNWPFCEASALNGNGVLDTLKMISKATLMALKKRLTKGRPETTTPAVKRPAAQAPPARPGFAPPPARPAGAPLPPPSRPSGAHAPASTGAPTGASTGPFAVPNHDASQGRPAARSDADSASFPAVEPLPEPASFENVFSSFELTPESVPAEPVLSPIQPTPAAAAPAPSAPAPVAPAPVARAPIAPPPAFGSPAPAPSVPVPARAPQEPREVPTMPALLKVEVPASAAPPPKPKSKSYGLDALAELEKLRKEAFTPKSSSGKAAAVAAAATAAASSTATRNGKQEISRELKLSLNRTNFNRARRFSLTVQLEDAEHQPVDVARHLHVDLDDVSSLEQLLLRLDIALQSSA